MLEIIYDAYQWLARPASLLAMILSPILQPRIWVAFVGFILAVRRWGRHPRVSKLIVWAISIFVYSQCVVSAVTNIYGRSTRFGQDILLTVATLILGILQATTLALLLAAALTMRSSAPTRSATAAAEGLDGGEAPRGAILPGRLGDPLRFFRRILVALEYVPFLIVGLVVGYIGTLGEIPEEAATNLMMLTLSPFIVYLIYKPFNAFLLGFLPTARTNAIYLRTFRRDAVTFAVRRAIQDMLGAGFRLSGIRPPRRRLPTAIKVLQTPMVVLRYSSLKYMDLEAESDWFARLWRSLGDARCAFVDLRDLTEYVEREVGLTVACLGLSRVLFIGDASRDVDGWRRLVEGLLDAPPADGHPPQVAIWKGEEGPERQEFAADLSRFLEGLPAGTVGPNWRAYPLIESDLASRPSRVYRFATEFLQVALALALVYVIDADWVRDAAVKLAESGTYWPIAVFLGVLLLILAYVAATIVAFVRERNNREGRKALWAGAAVGLFYVVLLPGVAFVLLQQVWKARAELYLAQGVNYLKQVGLAFHNFASVNDAFPPAYSLDRDGRPNHSWRVMTLPFLEESASFNAYNFKQPWDSGDNRRVLERMPEVYGRPGDKVPNRTRTPLLAVTGMGSALKAPRQPVREDTPMAGGTALREFSDGTSNTMLAVQAPEGMEVTWTSPQDLDASRLGELSSAVRGRGNGRDEILALFADGSVRKIRATTPPNVLNALSTIGGGEPVNPDEVSPP